METTLEFVDLLRLMDERSAAFREAVEAAPSLDVRVPTCPDWSLFDLVQHLGEVLSRTTMPDQARRTSVKMSS